MHEELYLGYLLVLQRLELFLSFSQSLLSVLRFLNQRLALISADLDLRTRVIGLGGPRLKFALLRLDLVLEVLGLVYRRPSVH